MSVELLAEISLCDHEFETFENFFDEIGASRLASIRFTMEDDGVLLGVLFEDELVDEFLENLLLTYFLKDIVNFVNGATSWIFTSPNLKCFFWVLVNWFDS